MGWQELLTSLVDSLVWPCFAAFAVLVFRRPLRDLIGRVVKVGAGPVSVDLGQGVQFAAQAAARTSIDTEKVLEPLDIPARLAKAEGPGPAEQVEMRLLDAVDEDEKRRRADIEKLIIASVQEGWALAHAGFRTPPWPRVAWDDDGRPSIRYSASSYSPNLVVSGAAEHAAYDAPVMDRSGPDPA